MNENEMSVQFLIVPLIYWFVKEIIIVSVVARFFTYVSAKLRFFLI